LLVSRREPRRALQRRDPERGSVSRRTLAAALASDYLDADSDCDTGPIDQRCPMGMTAESRTLSVSIHRHPDEVYAFVMNPENLPQWAGVLPIRAEVRSRLDCGDTRRSNKDTV